MMGVPPVQDWMGYPPMTGWGIPPSRTEWYTPCPRLDGYPPPSKTGWGYPPLHQQSEHLLRGGPCASCVHARGLSCYLIVFDHVIVCFVKPDKVLSVGDCFHCCAMSKKTAELMRAAKSGQYESLKWSVLTGADVNVVDPYSTSDGSFRNTALILAAKGGYYKCINSF